MPVYYDTFLTTKHIKQKSLVGYIANSYSGYIDIFLAFQEYLNNASVLFRWVLTNSRGIKYTQYHKI